MWGPCPTGSVLFICSGSVLSVQRERPCRAATIFPFILYHTKAAESIAIFVIATHTMVQIL